MDLDGLRLAAFCLLTSAAFTMPAQAQSDPGGCQEQVMTNPLRTLLTCPNGVKLVAEDGATFSLEDRAPGAGPEAVRLDGKAVLVEVPPGAVEGGFEVITPQAIAAVRGTKWAVDVAAGKTSVFVVDGHVAVRREPVDPAVTLGPGEGVDVEAGTGPLTVKHWGAARAAALLARFGE